MSLTPYEKFRYTSISETETEAALLKLHDLEEFVSEIGKDILGDASTAIIKEDCLQEEIDSLKEIISDMGTSKFKKTLLEFVEQLEEKQQEMGQQGEHAAEELDAVNKRWLSIFNLV